MVGGVLSFTGDGSPVTPVPPPRKSTYEQLTDHVQVSKKASPRLGPQDWNVQKT